MLYAYCVQWMHAPMFHLDDSHHHPQGLLGIVLDQLEDDGLGAMARKQQTQPNIGSILCTSPETTCLSRDRMPTTLGGTLSQGASCEPPLHCKHT